MSPLPQPTFTTDERVLCYHGPLIYEAKARPSPPPPFVCPRVRSRLASARLHAKAPALTQAGAHLLTSRIAHPRLLPTQVLKVDHDKRDFGKEKLSGTLYYVHYKGWKASCVVPRLLRHRRRRSPQAPVLTAAFSLFARPTQLGRLGAAVAPAQVRPGRPGQAEAADRGLQAGQEGKGRGCGGQGGRQGIGRERGREREWDR